MSTLKTETKDPAEKRTQYFIGNIKINYLREFPLQTTGIYFFVSLALLPDVARAWPSEHCVDLSTLRDFLRKHASKKSILEQPTPRSPDGGMIISLSLIAPLMVYYAK